jgi:hypothetical protein
MKPLFCIILSILAVSPLYAGLLVNPGFENGENNWKKWCSGKSMELRISDHGRDNSRSAVITGKDDEKAAWAQLSGALPAGDYVFSAWVRTSGLSGHVELQVTAKKDGKIVNSKKITATGSDDWIRLQLPFRADISADQWVLALFVQGPGTVWFDDADLVRGDTGISAISLEGLWKFHPGDNPLWADADFSDADWTTIKVPALWEEEGYPDLEGFAWYRKQIELSAAFAGKNLLLTLGAVSKADEVYFNGRLIGKTGNFAPNFNGDTYGLRRYLVPSSLLNTKSANTLAVRVNDGTMGQSGGIWKKPCELRPARPDDYLNCRVTSAVPGNIFAVGGKATLTMTWINDGDIPLKAVEISGEITDYNQVRIKTFTSLVRLDPGQPADTVIKLETLSAGLYYLNFNLKAADDIAVKKTFTFGVLERSAMTSARKDTKFGIACHLNRLEERELEITLDLAAQAGFQWLRTGFLWKDLEKNQGEFNWNRFDRTIAAVKKRNLDLVPTLAIIPDWASSDPLGRLGKRHKSGRIPVLSSWEKYIHAMVKRYSDYCHYWEIWNEPNLESYWKPSPDSYEYFQLLAAAYRQAKLADPQSVVILAGLVPYLHVKEPGLSESVFLDDLYKYSAGQSIFDRIGYHPYPRMRKDVTNLSIEQDLENMFTRLSRTVAANGDRDRRLWLTEAGCADLPRTISERRQAECLVVIMTICAAEKDVEKIFWYNFQEDGDNPDDAEQNYGLVHHDFTPKPVFFAYHTLIGKLAGAKFAEKTVSDGVIAYRFSRNGQIHVVWADKETSWQLPDPEAKVFDLMGKPLPVISGWIKVGTAPVYIELEKGK